MNDGLLAGCNGGGTVATDAPAHLGRSSANTTGRSKAVAKFPSTSHSSLVAPTIAASTVYEVGDSRLDRATGREGIMRSRPLLVLLLLAIPTFVSAQSAPDADRQSGSIRSTQRPSTTAASHGMPRGKTTGRSRTSRRRSGSIQNSRPLDVGVRLPQSGHSKSMLDALMSPAFR